MAEVTQVNSSELPSGSVRLEILSDSTLGYASLQNNVPLIRELRISNDSDAELVGVEITIETDPVFAEGYKVRFDRLAIGESRRLAPIDVKLHHSYVAALTEIERARIKASVIVDGKVQTVAEAQIELLAYDQWAGTRALPELLAAFCMPNAPAIDVILNKASRLLQQSAAGSLDGYQSKNRERVRQQISSLFNVIAAEEIQYSNPPASFGTDGQKIRTPERIATGKVATCLDLALMVASCLEQIGLNAVVLFKKEHAWVGCWLLENSFPTPVVDDPQAVRKRVKTGELLVFETTLLAHQGRPSLKTAMQIGEEHLANEADFQFAIDIKRARERRILPLPSKGDQQFGVAVGVSEGPAPIEEMPPLPPLDPEALAGIDLTAGADTPAGRLARWKSKLLDLTLRNRLLNFKPTKSNIQLYVPDPASMEDVLADGADFRVRALPKIMDGADPRVSAVHVTRTGAQPIEELARDAMSRHELLAQVEADKLDGRLLEIFSNAKLSLEEGGSNTLFLAIGFLKWTETDRADVTHLAPILMVPVTLKRQSVRSGFTLSRHDDEAMVNPTLLQLLREEYQLSFSSLDPLPKDEGGVDVEKVWQTVRLAIGEIRGWEVLEHVYLGTFSFTKYLMWKDLQDRTDALRQSRVVAHLIDHPGEAFGRDGDQSEFRSLDETHRPHDIFAPMLADSSQLRALCTAAEGRDFVLEGPPGTGKSQTITNLVAHFLALGKTVLFVSEKMAALDVVHRRLNAIGLGPFCLQLHSAKAKKAEVLQQLGNALNFSGAKTASEWEREADRLAALRQELNVLVALLHKPHSNELTVFEATGLAIQHRAWAPASLPWPDPETHDKVALEALRETMRQVEALAVEIDSLREHPLLPICRLEWSPLWEDELFKAAESLDERAKALGELAEQVSGICGTSGAGLSLQESSYVDELTDVLLKGASVPRSLTGRAQDTGAYARLNRFHLHGVRRKAIWDEMKRSYVPTVASLNAVELTASWYEAKADWWPKKWFSKRSVSKQLIAHRVDKSFPAEAELEALLLNLEELNKEDAALASLRGEAEAMLESEYRGFDTDWLAVEKYKSWMKLFSEVTAKFAAIDVLKVEAIRARVLPLVGEHRATLDPGSATGACFLSYRDAYRELLAQMGVVGPLAGCGLEFCGEPSQPGAVQRIRGMVQRWIGARRQIRNWCLWQALRSKAMTQGLAAIVSSLEAGHIRIDQAVSYFEFSYQLWWLKHVIGRDPVLRSFASAEHERKIREFRAADKRFQQLTQDFVVARLAGKIPNANLQVGPDSEMGRLRRELQRQRGLMPLRQLIQSLPTLLPKLKPCLLMSPLSVAQYLNAGHQQFDLVVFDEASQIPVWDAVGAIARGKQLVVVGDPKQMPPTNFFGRSDDPDEAPIAESEVKDLESILDECLGAGLRQQSLDWHYRSKHESLIAFSNVTYYDSRLITFPSAVTKDTAVSFRRVMGTYDRGGSRTNRAEAEAIVEEIGTHFLDPKRRVKSLGVVTFNQTQMQLIQTLLEERRRSLPELDRLISEKKDEELFIKNLENVQGDERDIVLFSITYGTDSAGRTTMGFGPLNLEGGQRRLNVAISRAREQVVIFSTLHPDQIDLSRVGAAGVRDLKNYLDFAIRGARALVDQSSPSGREPDSPFEVEVIRALREKGWTVHPQVGCTGYRIDIGVVDPRSPGRYLLGVECDGRSYHSGATARDRDRLRQHILEGLGWKMHRIWSTDWWTNHEREIQKLHGVLESLANESAVDNEEVAPAGEEGVSQPSEELGPQIVLSAAPSTSFPIYKGQEASGGDPSSFYSPVASAALLTQLMEVTNAEGPVSEETLFKKVSRAWGLERTGPRIVELLRKIATRQLKITREGRARFYWPSDLNPEEWRGFRGSDGSEESRRHVDDLAVQEIANLAAFLLDQGGSTSSEELAKTVCRTIGMARATEDAQKRARAGIVFLVKSGRATEEEERVRLVN